MDVLAVLLFHMRFKNTPAANSTLALAAGFAKI
jgi:hypothetical protein